MNRLFVAIGMLISAVANAQDLASKIPHDAFAVVNIRTDHFFELISVDEFNATTVGQAIREKADEAGLEGIQGVSDFGIALDRTAYFYAKLTDSVTYFNFLLPIADASSFERYFAKGENVDDLGSYKRFRKEVSGDSTVFAWDNSALVISSANLVGSYFEQPEVAERYGIMNYNYDDYYGNDYDTAAEADSAYANDWSIEGDTVNGVWEVDTTLIEADAAYGAYGYDDYSVDTVLEDDGNPYDMYYAADQAIKQRIESEWAAAHASALFGGMVEESVLANRSYLASLSKDALASVWIPSFESIYTALVPELADFRSPDKLFSYYGSLQAGLFADKEGFKLKSTMEVNDHMAKSFKRMYGGKLNRKFLRYLNTDDAIGYFSIAMDSKAYLEELPALMKDTYGGMFSQYADDIDLGAELLSLMLDEGALAKVAKGDALFVLNGVAEKEVPYTSYEYDDDYNYQEVEKTKMETIPDFLFMFSSDDAAFYNRVMSYVMRKGYLMEESGVYQLVNAGLPFDLLFTRKEGIVFIGTSVDQLQAIASNQYRGKLDGHARKMLTKNKFVGLLSAKKLSAQIPPDQLASLDRYIAFHKMFGSMGDFYFTSKGIKGNTVSGEFVAQTPAGFDNAVQYLFALVDYATEQR
ncbi:hypothetical protein [Parapedobacter sp. 2B3]|uniref:hypothetical protein n=1 Tax=Parapedobacter sp. 2B3 TaxID=3342381 RepID=UPI0035B5E4B0